MKTQQDKVLTWLRAREMITQLQALEMFGIMRLGAIIFNIRQEHGRDYIVTETLPVKNRHGQTVYIARYLL